MGYSFIGLLMSLHARVVPSETNTESRDEVTWVAHLYACASGARRFFCRFLQQDVGNAVGSLESYEVGGKRNLCDANVTQNGRRGWLRILQSFLKHNFWSILSYRRLIFEAFPALFQRFYYFSQGFDDALQQVSHISKIYQQPKAGSEGLKQAWNAAEKHW